MLAPIFGRKPELRSVYPDDVWTYLNTAPVNDPRVHVAWKAELIDEWVKLGDKIDQLASRMADQKKLSIDVLTDRSAMLLDLRSRLSLMSRDLRDLMKSVSIPPPH